MASQFRGASAGTDMPMTRMLREYDRPIINVEQTEYGMRLITLREIDDERTHVRVTNQLFPHAFVIPMNTEMTITQWHVPIDDENCYWYAIFTSYSTPVDKTKDARPAAGDSTNCPTTSRAATGQTITASIRRSRRPQTFTGMGSDINVHDQWAVESMGAIQDRTREHLGTADKAIVQYRRLLRQEIDKVLAGAKPFMCPRCRACPQHPGSGDHGRHRADARLGNLLDGSRRQTTARRAMGGAGAAGDRGEGAAFEGGVGHDLSAVIASEAKQMPSVKRRKEGHGLLRSARNDGSCFEFDVFKE